jgi:hypothetical protein
MWRVIYWLLTGAPIGFGFIAILSVGSLFLLLGVLLVVLGASRVGPRGIWAALLGCGAVPAGILIWDVVSAPWACESGDAAPNINYYSCVDTPVGPLTTYHILALVFGVSVLVGLGWPLAQRIWARLRTHVLQIAGRSRT